MLGDHGALIAVQGDAGVVEGLLGVFEDVVELRDAALEHRAEVTGYQRPADRCEETKDGTEQLTERTRLLNDVEKIGSARGQNETEATK